MRIVVATLVLLCAAFGAPAAAQTPCLSGYVWREAAPGDAVCVIPQSRDLAAAENAAAALRREPGPRGGLWYCLQGYVWREAFAGDYACVTPAARDRVAAENAAAPVRRAGGAPDFRAPGRHTLLVGVSGWRGSSTDRWMGDCRRLNGFRGFAQAGMIGWGQVEYGGAFSSDPCASFTLEQAFAFDRTLLDMVPVKRIERAILRWDEDEGSVIGFNVCSGLLVDAVWRIPLRDFRCWQDGDGRYERKRDSCAIVTAPTADWQRDGGAFPGHLPQTVWGIAKLGVRHYDVTGAVGWQLGDAAHIPFQPPGGSLAERGYGLAFSSPLYIRNLTGQDNTVCVSNVSNVTVEITYVVPPVGGQGPVVR